MASEQLFSVDVKEVLRFFDEGCDRARKHASSISGVLGEDLSVACLQHYLENQQDAKVTIRPESVTTGRRKGPRLDRWIVVKWPNSTRTLFQTEIKNWSSHSLSGEPIGVDVTSDELMDYKDRRWKRRWNPEKGLIASPTQKVLERMKPPDGFERQEIRPLLIFWEGIGPRDQAGKHLFCVPTPTAGHHEFEKLWVFSVSSYLRSILNTNTVSITLSMPQAAERINVLRQLVSVVC